MADMNEETSEFVWGLIKHLSTHSDWFADLDPDESYIKHKPVIFVDVYGEDGNPEYAFKLTVEQTLAAS